MIRVDVLDSSPIFLIGLAQVLTEHGIRVVGARTSVLAPGVRNTPADVFLIDPEAVPVGTTEHVAAMARLGATLVLVAASPAPGVVDGLLRAGARGVVSKQAPADGLVAAVRTVAAGRAVNGHPNSSASDPVGVECRHDGRMMPLSDREEQVLQQIAHGLTHTQIARRLGISPYTVDTYIKRIRAKLGAGNKAELTRAAMLRTAGGQPARALGQVQHRG